MFRVICLLAAVGCLATLPGCSSCAGNSCRRPSFMEFRNTGRRIYRQECGVPCDPCGTPTPCCEPCGSAGPCCEGVMEGGTVISPGPVTPEPGTFS